MKCPRLKPVRGSKRDFAVTTRGVRYRAWHDFVTGRWVVDATIGGKTRPIGEGGSHSTKASASRTICDHAKFYKKYVLGR